MRRYDDPVDVRRGMVDGSEGPEQFLWRGRLWKVNAVVAHWVETGAWWESPGARAVLGTDSRDPGRESTREHAVEQEAGDDVERETERVVGRRLRSEQGVERESQGSTLTVLPDLTTEREVWRVEASRGRLSAENGGGGVFDLLFDWAEGSWRLARCVD